MRRHVLVLLAAGALGTLSAQAAERPRFAEVGAITRTPIGWTNFCKARPDECKVSAHPSGARMLYLDQVLLGNLKLANDYVNGHIEPVTDLEYHKTIELWTYPAGKKGDCEDYVLLKRHLLHVVFRLPLQTLLITVVKDKNGNGHAVLTVVTTGGEYVLDNQEPAILLWADTGYQFHKRQSQDNPNVWVELRHPPLRVAVSRR